MFHAKARVLAAVGLLVLITAAAEAESKPGKKPRITPQARVAIIRALNAELVFVRKAFPSGKEGYVIRPDGRISPSDQQLANIIAQHGPAARPGDRAAITAIEFKDDELIFEINGGPKKKKKWWQRITIMGPAGGAVSQGPDQTVRGSSVTLEFDRHLPEMTPDEVKALLAPLFDFSSRSAAQAYADSLPPKLREAIKEHRVLVGMNREMVGYAKGRPGRRIREREGDIEYEEWIYGEPPADVEFVRFVGDEVVQLKIMRVDGEKIVRTEKEIDLEEIRQASLGQAGDQPGGGADQQQAPKPAKAPTLRRPGEQPQPTTTTDAPPAPPQPQTNPDSGPWSEPSSEPTAEPPAEAPAEPPQ